ncbi:probable peptidoglycan muropeptide transporter SLC46 [Drosophila sulfurigaster albostrigata]|uniref:probable peptidoglycan muropeptide transporter SLC46 n=1 Tax=Drosophila sulfurigaster albostrigata TaxID=89887 RepID=UPI002D21C6B0|nr:probable peptidoglycan muropeptide transporter SLC46 [Drosophila sulfurigaster albostrigata]
MNRSDEAHLVSDNEDEEFVSNDTPRLLDAAHSGPEADLNPANAAATPEDNSSGLGPAKWFILEPAVFFIFMARSLIGAVIQNQILYQTCVTIMHYNESDCEPLLGNDRGSEATKKLEVKVQSYSADITMAISLLESIIPAFVSLFIGPWSDKFGRRPILLTVFTGYVAGATILIGIAEVTTFRNISPWWFLLPSVPSVLSGGTCALITGIYCYISDVANEKRRAVRMVLNEASLCTGLMVGNVASGYIYAFTGSVILFGIAAGLMLLGLIYVVFLVPESLPPEQMHHGSKIREFFRFSLVKDLVRTCLLPRANFDRAIIWLTMVALTISIFDMEGENTVSVLFLREQFNWTIKEISQFNAARIIIQIVGSVAGMFVLRRVLRVSTVGIAMLALAACVLESTVRATATVPIEMYVGMTLGMMRGVLGPMCRAILSHVAPGTDVGKIFALTTSMEMVSPLVAAPLYTAVYKATVAFYPGAFNFISAGMAFLCYILMAIIFGIVKSMGSGSPYKQIGS